MGSQNNEACDGQALGEGVLLWPEDPPLHLPGPTHPQHQRPAGAQSDQGRGGLQLQVVISEFQLTLSRYYKWAGGFQSLGWGYKLNGKGFGVRLDGSSSLWNTTLPVLLEGANVTLDPDHTFIYAICNKTKGEEVYKNMLLYVPTPAPR